MLNSKIRMGGHFVQIPGTGGWDVRLSGELTRVKPVIIGEPFHVHEIICFRSLDFVDQPQDQACHQ